jgi:aerobic-type carbon monoxide dehydrogenase small subunit (CoxS/CutS family)
VRRKIKNKRSKKEKYMTEKKKNGSGGKTRREFLKDASLLVGGTAIGSTVLLAACAGETETETVTQTRTVTTTTTATESKFIDPIDGMEFDTLTELQAHFASEHPMGVEGLITLNVNGEAKMLVVKPYWDLAFVLREKLGLVGLKLSCDRGTCGTCTVIMDGVAIYSCMTLAMDADGKQLETIEGLSNGGTMHPIQQAFLDHHAFQCGYCTPGMIMMAKALLAKTPNPTHDEVREGMSGHFCSCGNTKRITEAVEAVGGG